MIGRIIEAEEKVKDRHFQERGMLQRYLSQHAPDLEKVFDISKEKGPFVLKRDKGHIDKVAIL